MMAPTMLSTLALARRANSEGGSSLVAGELAAAAHGNQAKKPERTRNRPNRFNEVAEAETSPSPPSPGKQKGGRRKAGGKYNTSRLSNTANATSLTHSTTSTSATTNQLTARKSKGEGSATAGDAAAAPKFVTATAPSANNPALQSSNGGGLEKYVAPMPRILMVNGDRFYKCPAHECPHQVRRMPDYIKHYRGRHDEQRFFVCRLAGCGKDFKDSTTRCRHERTHEAVEFQCSHCERKYTRKDNLRMHMRKQHGISGQQLEDALARIAEKARGSKSAAPGTAPNTPKGKGKGNGHGNSIGLGVVPTWTSPASKAAAAKRSRKEMVNAGAAAAKAAAKAKAKAKVKAAKLAKAEADAEAAAAAEAASAAAAASMPAMQLQKQRPIIRFTSSMANEAAAAIEEGRIESLYDYGAFAAATAAAAAGGADAAARLSTAVSFATANDTAANFGKAFAAGQLNTPFYAGQSFSTFRSRIDDEDYSNSELEEEDEDEEEEEEEEDYDDDSADDSDGEAFSEDEAGSSSMDTDYHDSAARATKRQRIFGTRMQQVDREVEQAHRLVQQLRLNQRPTLSQPNVVYPGVRATTVHRNSSYVPFKVLSGSPFAAITGTVPDAAAGTAVGGAVGAGAQATIGVGAGAGSRSGVAIAAQAAKQTAAMFGTATHGAAPFVPAQRAGVAPAFTAAANRFQSYLPGLSTNPAGLSPPLPSNMRAVPQPIQMRQSELEFGWLLDCPDPVLAPGDAWGLSSAGAAASPPVLGY